MGVDSDDGWGWLMSKGAEEYTILWKDGWKLSGRELGRELKRKTWETWFIYSIWGRATSSSDDPLFFYSPYTWNMLIGVIRAKLWVKSVTKYPPPLIYLLALFIYFSLSWMSIFTVYSLRFQSNNLFDELTWVNSFKTKSI